MSVNEHIKEISESSKNGNLTIFVGAGVSKLSNYPDWKELTDEFAKKIGLRPKQSYSNEEYLSIPQKYYYSIGSDDKEYYTLIKEILDKDIEPNIVHNLILSLKPVNIITTNFDNLIEKSVSKNGLFYDVIASDLDVANAKNSKYILKVHGDLEKENIVLKEEDYLNYEENFKLVGTLLKSIFSTNIVVFIGYSLGDYNIKLILNWVRNLQGEGFKKPYFIYVNENELNELDRIYYNSRGLEILDYKEFSVPKIDYLQRYKVILEKIIYFKENQLLNSSGQINYLFSKFKDLNKLNVLRREDIFEKIKDDYIIDESGYIRKYNLKADYIEKFNDLHNTVTSKDKIGEIAEEILQYYRVIKAVFTKGQVLGYINEEGDVLDYEFIPTLNYNMETINLDYKAMEEYIKSDFDTVNGNFKKAYFLFKLGCFKEAYILYSKLAQECFISKDYLMYYFSQINRYNSYNAIKSLGKYAGSVAGILTGYAGEADVLSEEDELVMKDFSIDEIFDSLPLTFKNKYASLKDLYNQKGLYKNIYSIKKATDKVHQSINNKSTEFGFTSIGKVIGILNPNLNFVYGNYLIVDEYEEFKTLVKESIKSILLTYSDKNNKYITVDDLQKLRSSGNGLKLDSFDFACLIQYFTTKELKEIFRNYSIKQLDFLDFDKCFNIAVNILEYFENDRKHNYNRYLYQKLALQINNVVEVLKFVPITQEQYKYVVNKIFKIENNTLNIGNKILFLDMQQAFNPNIQGDEISKILEGVFNDYLNELINSLNQNKQFNEHSVNSLFHINIINYIVANDNQFKSAVISKQVEQIIKSGNQVELEILVKTIPVLFQDTIDKLITLVRENMEHHFNFNIFKLMINNNFVKDYQKYEDILVEYIKDLHLMLQKLKETKIENSDLPDINRLSEISKKEKHLNDVLESVGYWSLIGVLNKDKYYIFKGINNLFDLFIDIDDFDFEKFDDSWLLILSKKAHRYISFNEKAKKYTKIKIEEYLNDSSFDIQQKEKLLRIYLDFYNR